MHFKCPKRLLSRAALAGLVVAITLPVAGVAPRAANAAGVRLVEVESGFVQPVAVTSAGDGTGRLFVVEKTGRIRIVRDGNALPTPFLNIAGIISTDGERGLLGLAFHPNYETNRFFYVHYTAPNGDVVIARYRVSDDPNVANPGTGIRLLTIPHRLQSNHNGGTLAFGPRDGYLYISVGDGGRDQSANGQRTDTLLGKILRIDVNNTSGNLPYAIPADNPFRNGGGRREIWAYGLRNPYRFSLDRANGNLFIGDVGQSSYEEIDFGRNGKGGLNFGWDTTEGNRHCYDPPTGCDLSGITFPIHEYPRSVGRSVTGGYVYRGQAIPALIGTYIFSDYTNGDIFQLKFNAALGRWQRTNLYPTDFAIVGFGESDGAELFAVDIGSGKLYRLANAAP